MRAKSIKKHRRSRRGKVKRTHNKKRINHTTRKTQRKQRKQHTKSRRHKRGGKKIGEGGFGCTYHPPMRCKDKPQMSNQVATKLVKKGEIESELAQNRSMDDIDPENRFHIGLVGEKVCIPASQEEQLPENQFSDCRDNGVYQGLPLEQYRLILMKYGGVSLDNTFSMTGDNPVLNLLRSADNPELSYSIDNSDYINLIVLWHFIFKGLERLFRGLVVMAKNRILHNDIKVENIVAKIPSESSEYANLLEYYMAPRDTPEEQRKLLFDLFEMNYIDFGLSMTFRDFFNYIPDPRIQQSLLWFNYAPEKFIYSKYTDLYHKDEDGTITLTPPNEELLNQLQEVYKTRIKSIDPVGRGIQRDSVFTPRTYDDLYIEDETKPRIELERKSDDEGVELTGRLGPAMRQKLPDEIERDDMPRYDFSKSSDRELFTPQNIFKKNLMKWDVYSLGTALIDIYVSVTGKPIRLNMEMEEGMREDNPLYLLHPLIIGMVQRRVDLRYDPKKAYSEFKKIYTKFFEQHLNKLNRELKRKHPDYIISNIEFLNTFEQADLGIPSRRERPERTERRTTRERRPPIRFSPSN